MTKKGRRTQRRAQSTPEHVGRVPVPRSRVREPFRVLDEVTREADRAVPRITLDRESGRVFAAIFVRGNNCLKSIKILLQQAHWETASGISRQLFEILLNTEYLVTQDDVESAAFRYAKYGLLQMTLHEHAAMVYDQKTGRAIDIEKLRGVEGLLGGVAFEEFRDKKSHDGWATSWSRHSAWRLASLSSQPMRRDQYQLMFRPWSEQAHAAPASMLPQMLTRPDEDWIKKAVAEDDARVAESIATSVTFFLELWQLLPKSASMLEPSRTLDWTSRLIADARTRTTHSPNDNI